jgi:hypothetical protein
MQLLHLWACRKFPQLIHFHKSKLAQLTVMC